MKNLLLLPLFLLLIKDPCLAQTCQASFTWSQTGPGQITFTSTSTGTNPNTMYYWNFGDSQTAWTQNPVHSYSSPGSYTVCLTIFDSLSCQSSTCSVIQVTGNPPACNANFTFTVNGNTVNFTNTSTGGTTYYWVFGDNGTSNQTNPQHTYANSGSYTVCLIIQDSNCVDSVCQNVVIGSSGIHEGLTDVENISLFPNPSYTGSTLELTSMEGMQIDIQLMDVTGKNLMTIASEKVEAGTHRFSIPTEQIAAGVYMVRISDGKGSLTKRLTVIH